MTAKKAGRKNPATGPTDEPGQQPTPDADALTESEVADSSAGAGTTIAAIGACLLYTSPSPRDRQRSRMPSSA